jgi:hypothetical protein
MFKSGHLPPEATTLDATHLFVANDANRVKTSRGFSRPPRRGNRSMFFAALRQPVCRTQTGRIPNR